MDPCIKCQTKIEPRCCVSCRERAMKMNMCIDCMRSWSCYRCGVPKTQPTNGMTGEHDVCDACAIILGDNLPHTFQQLDPFTTKTQY
jgi:hypothetical protein